MSNILNLLLCICRPGLHPWILNIFGGSTVVRQSVLQGPVFGVDVKAGCDGMETIAIFLCAILSTPFSMRLKWRGLVAGLGILLVLNILRIAGLYLAGIHWPAAFDALHLHGGFVLFLFVALIIWFVWANWALKQESLTKMATGPKKQKNHA